MYTCICGKQISAQSNYSRHRKTCIQVSSNASSLFICSICQKEFARKDSMKRHLAKCSPKKIIACAVCQKVFSSNWKLKRHLSSPNVHNKDTSSSKPINSKPNIRYKCRQCPMEYERLQNFRKHMIRKHRVRSTDPVTLTNYKVTKRVSIKTQELLDTCASNLALDIIRGATTKNIQ
jgi:uncharacterized Zn-finger protein